MPITEFVRPSFKPECAEEAFSIAPAKLRDTASTAPGVLSCRVGHILFENGVDVEKQYKIIAGLEWDSTQAFHAFFPAAPELQEFIGSIMRYAAAPAPPQLFESMEGYVDVRSVDAVDAGVTQVFIGNVGDGDKGEVEGAWKALVKIVGDVKCWAGRGIEKDEGVWAGVLGWKDMEEYGSTIKNAEVSGVLEKLKAFEGLDELIAKFE